jgi:hypothetical protein
MKNPSLLFKKQTNKQQQKCKQKQHSLGPGV